MDNRLQQSLYLRLKMFKEEHGYKLDFNLVTYGLLKMLWWDECVFDEDIASLFDLESKKVVFKKRKELGILMQNMGIPLPDKVGGPYIRLVRPVFADYLDRLEPKK